MSQEVVIGPCRKRRHQGPTPQSRRSDVTATVDTLFVGIKRIDHSMYPACLGEPTVTVGWPRGTKEQLGHHAVTSLPQRQRYLGNNVLHAKRHLTRWTSCPSSTEVTHALATLETPQWTMYMLACRRQVLDLPCSLGKDAQVQRTACCLPPYTLLANWDEHFNGRPLERVGVFVSRSKCALPACCPF